MSAIVRDAVEAAEFVHSDDMIGTAGFDEDTGQATARIRAGPCFSEGQVEKLRESEMWELAHVHSSDGCVDVHIREIVND